MDIRIGDILQIKSKEFCVPDRYSNQNIRLTKESFIKVIYIESKGDILLKDLNTGLEFIEDYNNLDSFYNKITINYKNDTNLSVKPIKSIRNDIDVSINDKVKELEKKINKRFELKDKLEKQYRWRHPRNNKRR